MLFIGADHAGFKRKEELKNILLARHIEFEDLSPELVEGDDYPDIALKVAQKVVKDEGNGILICGSGIGVCIAANKVPGTRAANCHKKEEIELSRKHNDANILCLSGWNDKEKLTELLDAWFNTRFEGGRHQRRVDKIKEIEDKIPR